MLGQDLLGPLAELRAHAESRMGVAAGASECTVRRDVGLGEQQPDGSQPREWEVIHSQLPCRLSTGTGSNSSRTVTAAGGDVEVPVRTCSVPWNTQNLRDGDLIEITAGESAGQVLRIVESAAADHKTALRLPVIGAQRPEEW